MGNNKFRSDEFYKEALPKTEKIDTEVEIEAEPVSQQPFDVPIETESKAKNKVKTFTKHTTCKLRVRKAPNGEVLKILDNGAKVEVLKEHDDGWTELKDGTFVMSRFLK